MEQGNEKIKEIEVEKTVLCRWWQIEEVGRRRERRRERRWEGWIITLFTSLRGPGMSLSLPLVLTNRNYSSLPLTFPLTVRLSLSLSLYLSLSLALSLALILFVLWHSNSHCASPAEKLNIILWVCFVKVWTPVYLWTSSRSFSCDG